VVFGKGFSQNGTDTNSLDNLTLGGASSSNDLELAYNTGITQSGTATNTLKNLTLGDTGLTINDVNNIPQITIDPLGIIQLVPQGQNDFYALTNFYNEVDISGNLLRITNATPLGGEFRIVSPSNVIQISISAIGINQIDPTGENDFNGQTWFYNTIYVDTADINIDTGNINIDTGSLIITDGDFEITNGTINQVSGQSILKNLTVDNIAYTSRVILTNTSQDYSNSKTPNYIFHSRTGTNASGITLSTDTYIDDGQYLYIRKINTGSYTLTLTRGGTTTFLNLSNSSVNTIALTGLTGVSFIYDKPNTRWIQLT
jgi:hypothetical protein